MKKIVSELIAPAGNRKVQVFQRDDGTFGFESLRFSDNQLELSWIPHGHFSECIAPSLEAAEREARRRVDWLRKASTDG